VGGAAGRGVHLRSDILARSHDAPRSLWASSDTPRAFP
jgi:hypothetical protein